jgi:Bacterial pre-peptidase C-terminal domain
MKHLFPLLLVTPFLLAQDKKPPEKAEPPRVQYPMPLAVAPGAKVKVILRGQKLDAVTEVKASVGTVKLVGKTGRKAAVPNNFPAKKLGDTEVEFELELPKDFAGEFVELTAVSPGGTSEPYKLTVAKGDVAEKEPNDGFAQAQPLTLPASVAGTIGREKDTDVYQFTGKAGQTVTVDGIAAKLGAPTDALISFYDANRRLLATADDTDGHPDSTLAVKLPKDGIYFVSVLESNDLGGPQFGYRLRIK